MSGNPREMSPQPSDASPSVSGSRWRRTGLGRRHARMTGWLDENCGCDGWAMTPSGTRGVLNDAVSLYFTDATLASAFVARWCVSAKVKSAGGVFRIREDEPAPRIAGAPPYAIEIVTDHGR